MPESGFAAPAWEVRSTEAIAAQAPTIAYPAAFSPRIRTPASRAASGFPPIAYMYRPTSSGLGRYHHDEDANPT